VPNRVYVVNQGFHDFSSAEKYGRLIYMTEGYQPKFSVATALRRFQFCMQESEQEDWILLTGLSVLNCIACSVFALKHNRLNLLLFDGKGYVTRTVIIDRQGEEANE
jgi:hypothetical protein